MTDKDIIKDDGMPTTEWYRNPAHFRKMQSTYWPGYQDGMDLPNVTYETSSNTIRKGFNLAFDAYTREDATGRTKFTTQKVSNKEKIRSRESELLVSRDAHRSECVFDPPDMNTIPLDQDIDPSMGENAICTVQSLEIYRLVYNFCVELNDHPLTETWTLAEFEQHLYAKCNLTQVIHQEMDGECMRVIFSLDVGRRFYLLFSLFPAEGEDQYVKRAPFLFLACKCRTEELI